MIEKLLKDFSPLVLGSQFTDPDKYEQNKEENKKKPQTWKERNP